MSGISIIEYERPEKVPAFADDVMGVFESGAHGQIEVAPEDEKKTRQALQAAARYHGLSARFERDTDEGVLIFRVVQPKPKAQADDTAAGADTPAE